MNFNLFIEVFDNLDQIDPKDFITSGKNIKYRFEISNGIGKIPQDFVVKFASSPIYLNLGEFEAESPQSQEPNGWHSLDDIPQSRPVQQESEDGNEKLLKISAYSITFEGPNGTRLTNSHNSVKVYGKLLAVVKAFIEHYKPPGLYFYGAVSSMDLMYNRFMKRFLTDSSEADPHKVFYQISENDYISKAKYYELDINYQMLVRKKMKETSQEQSERLQGVKKSKDLNRQGYVYAKNFVGGFIKTPNTLGLIYNVTHEMLEYIYVYESYGNLYADTSRKYFAEMESQSPQLYKTLPVREIMPILKYLFDPENAYRAESYRYKIQPDKYNELKNMYQNYTRELASMQQFAMRKPQPNPAF